MEMPKSFIPDRKITMPASFIPDTPTGIYLGEAFNAGLWHTSKTNRVVIPDNERRFEHCYMRGMTGAGKSNALKQIISQDLQDPKKGVIVMGPEPELFQDLLPYIPKERADDLIYFDPMDERAPVIGFNPFAFEEEFDSPEDKRAALLYKGEEVTTVLMRALGPMGVTMEPLVSAIARGLLLVPGASINDIPRLLDQHDQSLRIHIAALQDAPPDLP